MNKAKWLKVLNPALFVLILFQVVSVIIMKTAGSSFPVLPDLHEYAGYALMGLVLLHLALNFDWIKNSLFKKKARK